MSAISFPVFTLLGLLGLLMYAGFDFRRQAFNHLVKRSIMYSFLVYSIVVVHLTIGFIYFPPQAGSIEIQLRPFHFINDWMIAGQQGHWFFWNSVKLTAYNFLLFLPLGVYLVVLFKTRFTTGLLLLFLTSFMIETLQFVFSYVGLLFRRTFNIDDLLLNTLGGLLGMFVAYMVVRFILTKPNPFLKQTDKTKIS
ncbi:VanZ family protein [Exiguobacterium oxidotolerans]|uniref:VanZ family protein n=1 Tax=Exiguobacterium oxidotolerans TaxID=223958 RepID=A0A653IHI3_9BACL|nr:VanZ family protein [Exiguobacterium oxidotolerans]VWX38695.1 VanZ family protein [Exiguobacterium oxidotolerans]